MSSEDHVSIEGTLLMLDDATPHVAVPVQAMCDGKLAATVLSDEGGRYRFINMKPGRYHLRCQVLGGYVYYGEKKSRKPESQRTGRSEDGMVTDGPMNLLVEGSRTLEDIDFRFAPFKKGTWRTYNYLDGLAGNYVHTVYCDPDGLIWFGTMGGVSWYDGKEFVNLITEDGLGLGNVRAIDRDRDGAMWFGTLGNGVFRYDGNTLANLTTEDGLVDNSVQTIYRDLDGVIWFGTNGGVSRYAGKEFVNFTTEDGLVDNSINAIYCDTDGVMWFGTQYGGVSRYDGKGFINLTTEDGLANNNVRAIQCDPDGILWFATWGGVSRYDGKEFINFTTEDGLANNNIRTIYGDPDGVMWLGTYGGGVSRYDGKGFINLTTVDGLVNDEVHAIHRDPDGAMWFGTWGSGVSRYDPNEFISFTTKDGLPDNRIRAIHRDPDGVMWFGAGWSKGGSGLSRYDGKEFVNFTTADGLADDRVCVIYRDPEGVMWFGTVSGVSRYDGKEFVSLDGLSGNWIRAIHCDPDGMMWFGTGWHTDGSGAFRYDGKEFANFTTADGLGHNAVADIYCDPDGTVWFATGGGGVSRYDGKNFVSLTTDDGLLSNCVWNVYRDADDVLWFAASGGVSRYDGRQFTNFTKEDGVASSDLNVCCDGAICQDRDGVLWFATDGGGVSGYDGVAWTSLDTRDGLAGNRIGPILQDPDGFLWFATQGGGVTRYRKSATPPKVRIVSVTTDQVYRDLSAIPAFTPGIRVTIEYDSIDFKTLPEERQYRCRIQAFQAFGKGLSEKGKTGTSVPVGKSLSKKEMDTDWRKPTKATLFDHAFDKPGIYTFEVQAIDRDLNYSEPASLKLEVIPDPRNHQIAQLKGELAERERAELERVHQELSDARQIQQSLLPEKPPDIEGIDIAGTSLPAKEVSGDFYSYISLGANTGIVIADVTGKSVKAAMVAAMTSGMLNEALNIQSELWNSPSMILGRLNAGLQPHLIRGMYTAMSLGIIQPDHRRLIFSNAGMSYPIVKRGDEVWELEVNGVPLGLMAGAEYEDMSVDLEAGDLIIFCSDGIIEAFNEADEMYQTGRLLEVVRQADAGISAQEMMDLIVRDVTDFAGGAELSDDITIVVLRCNR